MRNKSVSVHLCPSLSIQVHSGVYVDAILLGDVLDRHREELLLLGVRERDRLLPPVAVKYISEQYGIDIDT